MLWLPGNLIDGSVDRMNPLALKPTMSTKCWHLNDDEKKVSGTEQRLSCINVPEMGSRRLIRPQRRGIARIGSRKQPGVIMPKWVPGSDSEAPTG